jgi:hypothetical protein
MYLVAVIPAKAGTQTETFLRLSEVRVLSIVRAWVPAFAGMTAPKCQKS